MSALEITTLIGCPLACTFCPQDALSRSYGTSSRMMSLDTFKKCIDKIPPHVRIDFSGMSEPFVNPNCIDFIKYASLKPNPIVLFTTLTGITNKICDELLVLIKSKRFNHVIIHLPDDSNNMPGYRFNKNYLYAASKLIGLDTVKTMTMSKNAAIDEKLLSEIEKLPNYSSIKKFLPKAKFIGKNRAGILDKEKVDNELLLDEVNWGCGIVCKSTPFYDHNVLLPDGRVVLCCMDYGMKHVIGNLAEQEYYELFESDEINKIKIANMSLDQNLKKDVICTQCDHVYCWNNENGIWSEKETFLQKGIRKIKEKSNILLEKIIK